MALGEGAENASEGPRAKGPFFAVKTTAGEEQAVAAAIRERAVAEHAPVASVISPKSMGGYVLVEGLDFDRLSNLVGAVRHARGVVRARGGGDASDSQIKWPDVEELLERAERGEDPESVEEVLRDLEAETPPPTGRTAPAKRRRAKAPEARSAQDRADRAGGRERAGLPLGHRQSLVLNLVIAVPPLALAAGLLLAPHIVWDQFLYPYFWRSIESDALNVGGSAEAYNVIDTLSYALLLVPALLFIWRVLDRVKVRVDDGFILMLTPFLILGGAARALEDAVYFKEPVVYAFIAPLIYVAEGFLVLAFVTSAAWVASTGASRGPVRGIAAWCAAFIPGAAALFLVGSAYPEWVAVPLPAPIVLAALAAAFLAGVAAVTRIRSDRPHRFVLIAGFLLLGIAAYLIVRWASLGAWQAGAAPPATTHLAEAPTIILLAASATAATVFGLWAAAPRVAWVRQLLVPVNALVLFGQFMDGAATYWGIDHFGYQEKHVLTGFFIEATGTAVVMFPIKVVFVLFVLYLIDVAFKEDLQDADGKPGTLAGLLKLTVLAIGLGPGTRDMLRLVMGV